jgi:transposase InsO family protein
VLGNAMAESFFATLKTEFYYLRVWPTKKGIAEGSVDKLSTKSSAATKSRWPARRAARRLSVRGPAELPLA